jgi:lipopolysaccharide transport protein LptA
MIYFRFNLFLIVAFSITVAYAQPKSSIPESSPPALAHYQNFKSQSYSNSDSKSKSNSVLNIPLTITADQVKINQLTNQAHYSGHVRVTQGDNHLSADELTVQRNPNTLKIDTLTAHTTTRKNLAQFRWQTDAQQQPIMGAAKTIVYQPALKKMILTEHASLKQADIQLQSSRIEYDLSQKTLISRSDPSTQTRTTIQLPEQTQFKPDLKPKSKSKSQSKSKSKSKPNIKSFFNFKF